METLTRLGTAVALAGLCIEVDDNPATRNHIWILLGIIVASHGIEPACRGSTGRRIQLVKGGVGNGTGTVPGQERE
jgi:hypothetical protein